MAITTNQRLIFSGIGVGVVIGLLMGLIGAFLNLSAGVTGGITGALIVAALQVLRRQMNSAGSHLPFPKRTRWRHGASLPFA
jgi:hypothetical protein